MALALVRGVVMMMAMMVMVVMVAVVLGGIALQPIGWMLRLCCASAVKTFMWFIP